MRLLALVAVLAVLVAAPAAQPTPLDSLAQAYAAEHDLPSLVLAASVGGERVVAAAGAVDTLGTPPDARTFYEIGSISKVLTGVLLADAVARGEVTLETPVRDLLPDSAMVAQHASGPIRLWHLSTHTSGLPRLFLEMGFAPGFDMADPYARFDTAALYQALAQPRGEAQPGETAAYSNVGVGLLGHALGHRAGTTYAALATDRVLTPLGLTETLAEVPDALAHRFPDGHDRGAPVPSWTLRDAMFAAGGWRSTAADLLTFGEAALDPAATPLADALALSLTPQFEIDARQRVGLGWFLGEAPGTGVPIAQHSGGTGGFRSFLAVAPEADVVVVVLTNSTVSVDPLGRDALRLLLHLDVSGTDDE